MKKLLTVALTTLTFNVYAQHHGYNHPQPHYNPPRHHHESAEWVIPALIGGAIIYSITNQPRQPEPPPVYVEPFPYQPQYEKRVVWDYQCRCYREVWVQIK